MKALVHALLGLREAQGMKYEKVELLTEFCLANGLTRESISGFVANVQPPDLGQVSRAVEAPKLKEAAEAAAEAKAKAEADAAAKLKAEAEAKVADDLSWHELQVKGSELGVYQAGMTKDQLKEAIAKADTDAPAETDD